MEYRDAIALALEVVTQVLADGDGAMAASRAADRNREICLPFTAVLWQREADELEKFFQIRLRQRIAMDIVGDLLRGTQQRLQVGNVVRICEKPHVEHKVG